MVSIGIGASASLISGNGEFELYDRKGRNHKGGFDPNDLTRQISKAVTRTTTGFKSPWSLPIYLGPGSLIYESFLEYQIKNQSI